jgi:hypothetical protein
MATRERRVVASVEEAHNLHVFDWRLNWGFTGHGKFSERRTALCRQNPFYIENEKEKGDLLLKTCAIES